MRYQYVLLIVGVIFIGCTQMPSNIYPTSREITINTDSTRIFAQFLIKPARVNPKDNLRYYWYYTDKISSNVGGYNGNLLNGNYRVSIKGKPASGSGIIFQRIDGWSVEVLVLQRKYKKS